MSQCTETSRLGAQRCSSRIERTLANITLVTSRGTCDARGASPSRSATTSAARSRYRRLGRRVSRSSSYVEQTNKSFEPRRARPLDAGAVGRSTSRWETRAEAAAEAETRRATVNSRRPIGALSLPSRLVASLDLSARNASVRRRVRINPASILELVWKVFAYLLVIQDLKDVRRQKVQVGAKK